MTDAQFADFISGFSSYERRSAMTMRPFLRIERLTYGELQRQIYKTANYLCSRNVHAGDRIMVVANNAPEWAELFLGCQLVGAIVVPVDVASSPVATSTYAELTEPKLIFRNRHLHLELGSRNNACVLDDLHESINDLPAMPPKVTVTGETSSLIVFTSGTTANPKGVLLTQGNILANAEAASRVVTVKPDWRFLSVLPLSHMYELTGGMLAPLLNGASIFYIPSVSPLVIAEALQEYHITTILAVPQLLVLLLERIRQASLEEGRSAQLRWALQVARLAPFSLRKTLFREIHSQLGGRLDLVITGGAPVPIEVEEVWEQLGVRILQGYGLTETSPILTMNPYDGRRVDSAGRPLDNVGLRIAEDGEIQAKGPSVFHEYWQDPTETRAAFTDDGWFKTGDAGRLDGGWLYVQGRIKFAIVLSDGLKVFPEDVELVADRDSCFQGICVVGVRRASGEEVVAVLVSGCPDAEVDEAIGRVNGQIESFQHIGRWMRWPTPELPVTRLLKIDRRQVQEWANSQGTEEEKSKPGAELTEDKIVRLIRQSLGEPTRHIEEGESLADLGLDSLRRLTVVALVEEQLGISVREEDVTQSTTVGELRALVDRGSPAARPVPRRSWPFSRYVRLVGDATREVLVGAIVDHWVKVSVDGGDNLDTINRPALYIFNHTDDFDGPVIYEALPRRVRRRLAVAAAADVMVEHKVLAFIIRFCFAGFEFARTEPYMASLAYVGTLIDQGWSVAIAPEGRVSENGELQPFKSGIGILAVNLGVPVVPVKTIGLAGTVPLHAKWPRHHSAVTVRIGEPVTYDSGRNYDDVTTELYEIFKDL